MDRDLLPYNILGNDLEALDPISIEFKAYIILSFSSTRKPLVFKIIGSNAVKVAAA